MSYQISQDRFFIQIRYSISSSLSSYSDKVKEKNWKFPSYHDFCPICHGQGCAVRIGYYYRWVFDLELQLLTVIPIARYKCQRKKKPKLKDLSFSLLPDKLIPYYSISIDTFMQIMELAMSGNGSNNNAILDFLYNFFPDKTLNISERTLNRYYLVFAQVHFKLKLFYQKKMNKPPPDFESFTRKELVSFIQTFRSPNDSGKGALGISDFYYSQEGSFQKNARFLFGTAYQFRN